MEFLTIFGNDLVKYILPFLLINEIIGIMNLPFTILIFKKFRQFAFLFSSAFGWLILSFLVFFLASTFSKYNTLNIYTVLGCLSFLFLTNLYIFNQAKSKIKLKDIFGIQHIGHKLIYLSLFFVMYSFLSLKPEIYQIERFMDFGFIQNLLNTRTLPLMDVWMSGTNLNYYYFGHFIAFIMCLVTGLAAEQIFFLCTSWVYAICGVGIFYIAKHIANEILDFDAKYKSIKVVVAGSLSLLFFSFSGPFHNIIWLKNYFDYLMHGGEKPFFWYADATRIIPGTITEFPLFTFLEASMHAHMWGFLMAILLIGVLADIFYDNKFAFNAFSIRIYVLSFILGVSFITNTWDVITLGLLSVAILSTKLILDWEKFNKFGFIWTVIINIFLFALIVLHWYIKFESPVTGLGWVTNPSEFKLWFQFWGEYLLIFLFFTTYLVYAALKKLLNYNEEKNLMFVWMLFATTAVFLMFTEISYLKDILFEGEWYRANTYFKITAQLWTWLSLASGISLVFLYDKFRNIYLKVLLSIFIIFIITVCGLIYPIKTWEYFHNSKQYMGISNPAQWLNNIAPSDYKAYQFLDAYKKSLPYGEKMQIILEGAGESYQNNNYFSVLLGWPSVIGWPVHEWTWRGSYNDDVGPRRSDVQEIYTGENVGTALENVNKYKVDFIIVGIAEKNIYKEALKKEKLKKLGNVIFEDGETFIVKMAKQ